LSFPKPFRNRGRYQPKTRINERIRAREVRVVDADGKQLGVLAKQDAINLAKQRGVDLVEVAATARPPVCRLVDFGKYRYEQSKKEKETKKHQHSNKVKEVQLSMNIDPHDLKFKLDHTVDFLCDDFKVKITLRFRGRENAHKEIGVDLVKRFISDLSQWGTPDFPPKVVGRGLNCMVSPLPKVKRAPNPRAAEKATHAESAETNQSAPNKPERVATNAAEGAAPEGFESSPFAGIELESTTGEA